MDPKGLNLRVTRLGEEADAMKVRLDVISLQRIMNSFKPELWKKEGNEIEMEEAVLLWNLAQVILTRCYGERGTKAIRLLKALVYFDDFAVDLAVFPKNKQESLTILKTCGLIQMAKINYIAPDGAETQINGILVHSRIFGEMILQENQRKEKEENLIGDCLMILRHTPARVNIGKRDRYFPGLWAKTSKGNYIDLMKEFKAEALQFGKTYYKRKPLQFTQFISKALEGLRAICKGEADKVFRLDCAEIELALVGSEEDLTEFKLEAWNQYFASLVELTQDGYLRTALAEPRVEQLVNITKILETTCTGQSSSPPSPLAQKFLEECLRGHKFAWNYFRVESGDFIAQPFHQITSLSGIFNCSAVLRKKEPILETLRQMFVILNEPVLPQGDTLDGDSSYWLPVIEDLLKGCVHFSAEEENEILRKLSPILKYMNDFVYNSTHPRYCLTLSKFTKSYMSCLVKLNDYGQIVEMVESVNRRWKKKCEYLANSLEPVRMDNFIQCFFNWQELFAFKNATTPAVAAAGHKEKLIKDSIATSKIVLDLVLGIGRGCATHYNYASVGPLYLVKCFLELSHVNELIQFSSDFELYMLQKFETDPKHLANEWVQFLECQIGIIKTRVAVADSSEKKPNYLPLLRTIEASTQRLSLEIGKIPYMDLAKSELHSRAQNIIEICDSLKNFH